MGREPDRLMGDFRSEAGMFFEPKLRPLGLAAEQIEQQEVSELEQSLERVNQLIAHPEQLGTYRAKFSAESSSFVIPKSTSEAQVDVGALPILLARKALILDRIKLLRPLDQIVALRDEITRRVEDPGARAELLQVLDDQSDDEKRQSSRLQTETDRVHSALELDRQQRVHEVALAELKLRVDGLDRSMAEKTDRFEKNLTRLEDRSVSKWDVVTVVFAVVAALGALVAAALGVARWVSGG